MAKVNRTTSQTSWTYPIALIARFNTYCESRMVRPSHVLTTLILEFLEKNNA